MSRVRRLLAKTLQASIRQAACSNPAGLAVLADFTHFGRGLRQKTGSQYPIGGYPCTSGWFSSSSSLYRLPSVSYWDTYGRLSCTALISRRFHTTPEAGQGLAPAQLADIGEFPHQDEKTWTTAAVSHGKSSAAAAGWTSATFGMPPGHHREGQGSIAQLQDSSGEFVPASLANDGPDESLRREHVSGVMKVLSGPSWTPCAESNLNCLLDIGASAPEVIRLFREQPLLFVYDASADLLENTSVLSRFGLQKQLLLKMQNPLVASTHIESVLHYLQTEFGFLAHEMQRLVDRAPTLLSGDLERLKAAKSLLQILKVPDVKAAILRHWQSGAMLSETRAAKRYQQLAALLPSNVCLGAVQRRPDLLRGKVGIRERVEELERMFGWQAVMNMTVRFPSLLMLKTPSLRQSFEELVGIFGEERARYMVLRHPNLLGVHADRIRKKVEYLEEKVGRSLEDIARWPAILCRSLHHSIIPRHEELGKLAHQFSLSYIMGCSDAVFVKRFRDLIINSTGRPESARTQDCGSADDDATFEEQTLTKRQLMLISNRTVGCRKEVIAHFGSALAAELIERDRIIPKMRWNRLLPKLVYLEDKMGFSREEIAAHPVVLRRGLLECIIPRHEALGARIHHWSLPTVYRLSHAEFMQKLKEDGQHGGGTS